jgi:hypothetical protein
MTLKELEKILKCWERETTREQKHAEEEYEYNRGKIAAFQMIVELLKKKE